MTNYLQQQGCTWVNIDSLECHVLVISIFLQEAMKRDSDQWAVGSNEEGAEIWVEWQPEPSSMIHQFASFFYWDQCCLDTKLINLLKVSEQNECSLGSWQLKCSVLITYFHAASQHWFVLYLCFIYYLLYTTQRIALVWFHKPWLEVNLDLPEVR